MQSPPPNFSFIEQSLARCTLPLSRQNLSFLQSISLGGVLNVSGEALDDNGQLSSYLEENGVRVYDCFCESDNLVEMEEWLARTLELLFSTIANAETSVQLIVGNSQDCLDCLLIACMRRVQDWALVPIISEFRLLQGPQLQQCSLDAEQFIEHFDVSVIGATQMPGFIEVHRTLLREEDALLQRLRRRARERGQRRQTKSADEGVKEQQDAILLEEDRVDEILGKLFFSSPGLVFSQIAATRQQHFDPAVSIVTEKDDED